MCGEGLPEGMAGYARVQEVWAGATVAALPAPKCSIQRCGTLAALALLPSATRVFPIHTSFFRLPGNPCYCNPHFQGTTQCLLGIDPLGIACGIQVRGNDRLAIGEIGPTRPGNTPAFTISLYDSASQGLVIDYAQPEMCSFGRLDMMLTCLGCGRPPRRCRRQCLIGHASLRSEPPGRAVALPCP